MLTVTVTVTSTETRTYDIDDDVSLADLLEDLSMHDPTSTDVEHEDVTIINVDHS